jgi:nicotinic acid mononucleotide adenylyltransferase
MIKKNGNKLKLKKMKKNNISDTEIKERIKKGLDLTFKKLLKTKQQTNGFFILSENGKIKKIKATDLSE